MNEQIEELSATIATESAIESRTSVKELDPELAGEPLTEAEYQTRKAALAKAADNMLKRFALVITSVSTPAPAHCVDLRTLTNGPKSGPRRGQLVESLLAAAETQTVVVGVDEAWSELLATSKSPLAAGAWRSVCSQVLGGGTARRVSSVQVFSSKNSVFYHGVPAEWLIRQEKVAAKPVAPKRRYFLARAAGSLSSIADLVFKDAKRADDLAELNGLDPETVIAAGQKIFLPADAVWPPKREPKSKEERSSRPAPATAKAPAKRSQSSAGAHGQYVSKTQDDLYLLCKGAYGEELLEPEAVVGAVRAVVSYHTGGPTALSLAVQSLFGTITSYANRGYWGNFGFLSAVVAAGGEGREALVRALQAQLTALPSSEMRWEEPRRDSELACALAGTIGQK